MQTTKDSLNLFSSILSDWQEWQDKTFPLATTLSCLKHLEKEVPELIDAVFNGTKEEKRMEFADAFSLLFAAARKEGFTLLDVCFLLEDKLEINKGRQWGDPDVNGVVLHKK